MNILTVPEILLPKKGINKRKWAVIACDQFTSEPDYWTALDDYCGKISTLRITFPEIYLGKNENERIKNINETMYRYLDGGVFDVVKGFILTVRKTKFGNKRVGILLAFDLEQYSVTEKLAVRATEAIVPDRLPIRIKIREDAPIELPHALLMIDDKEKSVIEPLYKNRKNLKKLYSTKLNQDGGTLEGYLIEDTDAVIKAIDEMTTPEKMIEKYGSDKPFVFAVGDGNHSIATAKACWEMLKPTLTEEERKTHPARVCLAEINNIYDEDLKIESIYRVVFGGGEKFVETMINSLSGNAKLRMVYNGKDYYANISDNTAQAIKDIQAVIDKFISENKGVRQDYIHGDDHLLGVARDRHGVAVFMPKLKKGDLFKHVANFGVLTRKSFSMGEAEEKRYYYEGRKIK
ncbi:MAG: DUF1015 domain-containing protein [Clostridia bacterium]|nr:DUF1015 domain-containing protein [Clostridia bacterium]